MIDVALSLEPLWENAIGKNWKANITRENLKPSIKKCNMRWLAQFIYFKLLGWKVTGNTNFSKDTGKKS